MGEEKNNQEEKFHFVTMEELEKNLTEFQNEVDNNFEIVESPEKVNVSSFEYEDNNTSNSSNDKELENDIPLNKKVYFSYEARVTTMIIMVLALIAGACYLILNVVFSGYFKEWNNYNTTIAVVASVMILLALFLSYRTTRLVLKVTNNKNKFQSMIMQILREYDRIIVIARDGYKSNVEREVVKVHTFDELLKIKDKTNKPIIYSKVNDIKCEFIIEDEEIVYKLVLKELDF